MLYFVSARFVCVIGAIQKHTDPVIQSIAKVLLCFVSMQKKGSGQSSSYEISLTGVLGKMIMEAYRAYSACFHQCTTTSLAYMIDLLSLMTCGPLFSCSEDINFTLKQSILSSNGRDTPHAMPSS